MDWACHASFNISWKDTIKRKMVWEQAEHKAGGDEHKPGVEHKPNTRLARLNSTLNQAPFQKGQQEEKEEGTYSH